MPSHHPESWLEHPKSYGSSLGDRFMQPSILVSLGILLLTIFYSSLHSSAPFSHVRHPGELLWDFIVTVTPARLLHAIDDWLHPAMFPVPRSMSVAQPSSFAAKSDTLRRILGMDNPNSLISAVANAGKNISTLSRSRSKRIPNEPPGLGNYDNSCFQNSILQSLASLKLLPAYLTSAVEDIEATDNERGASFTATLRDLVSKLADSQSNGTTLWTPKKLKSLDTWQQQDAQEYYSKILDEIDKDIRRVATTQYNLPGLEAANIGDDTVESQHSDDSGYQSLSTTGKAGSEAKATKNPLEGLVAQRVACVQCSHSEGLSMIPFNCITLSLGVGQGAHDLYERLDSYTALESIQGVECAKCTLLKVQRLMGILVTRSRKDGLPEEALQETLARLEAVQQALEDDNFEEETLRDQCKISKQNRVSSTKTKQMVIARAPSSLAIHINRSVFDENTGQMFKNLAAVRFPSTFDLGPWCLGSAGPYTANGDDAVEHWSSDPKRSMVSGDVRPSRISGPIYELRAVITHQGRHENGHYVCYRKHRIARREDGSKENEPDVDDKNGNGVEGNADPETPDDASKESKWWRLSDETVWEVTEEAVLAQGGVFMLFYDCVDPTSPVIMEDREGDSASHDEKASTSASEAREADEIPDMQAQYHDTQQAPILPAGLEAVETLTDPLPPRPIPVSVYIEDEQAREDALARILYPLLGPGEEVDSMIPLRWPNM